MLKNDELFVRKNVRNRVFKKFINYFVIFCLTIFSSKTISAVAKGTKAKNNNKINHFLIKKI